MLVGTLQFLSQHQFFLGLHYSNLHVPPRLQSNNVAVECRGKQNHSKKIEGVSIEKQIFVPLIPTSICIYGINYHSSVIICIYGINYHSSVKLKMYKVLKKYANCPLSYLHYFCRHNIQSHPAVTLHIAIPRSRDTPTQSFCRSLLIPVVLINYWLPAKSSTSLRKSFFPLFLELYKAAMMFFNWKK